MEIGIEDHWLHSRQKTEGLGFLFSEITDESVLHKLDNFVNKLKKRFKVSPDAKTFVRTFNEISHNRNNTKYIPDFDKYNLDQKKMILRTVFRYDLSAMSNERIEYEFAKKLKRQVEELETDIGGFS